MLGPILFLIYINGPPEVITACMKLFTDDAKLFGRVNSLVQATTVQISLDNAVDWAQIWYMNYHFQKCKHLHIGIHDINFEYTMQTNSGEMKVQKVTTEKDLGVTFDQNLKFTYHINIKVNKANRNVVLIFRTFILMDKDMFLSIKFYKSIIRPHLEYAFSVWSPMFKKDQILLENVQLRATRLVKCLKHLSYEDRLKTLGMPSLEYRRERSDMIQVYKIMHGIDKVDKTSSSQ